MKIVVQNFKTGALSVADSPVPQCPSNGILVRTRASLISAGTDKAVIGLAKKNPLGKALDRPDLAMKVINKAKTDGLWSTFQVVMNLISEPIPLGYSLVGEVVEVGSKLTEVRPGDRVACAGLGFANHAEFVAVPRNLFVRVPDGVDDEGASFLTLGAIAMHGIRQADEQFGAAVLVVGLGLVGQITILLCRAAGYRTIGIDLDPAKLELAKSNGAIAAYTPDDPNLPAGIAAITNGLGVDAVLLTLSSRDSGKVFESVAPLCRDRARVVVVGDVKIDLSRRVYFEKELEILQSRSYGPGRYDSDYETKGIDYPAGYVRWTERRNMQSFIDLLEDGSVNLKPLITHRFPIERATEAYELVTGNPSGLTIGILLEYGSQDAAQAKKSIHVSTSPPKSGKIGLGIIGTGQFAKGVLLPAIIGANGFDVIGVSSARGLSANSVRDRYKARFSTTESAEIFNSPEIDAVVIATRHDSHARLAIEALKQGKHVFLEKPLCLNETELHEIAAAVQDSSATLTVGYNRRFSPPVALIQNHFAGRVEPLSLLYRINAGRIPLKGELGWVHDPEVGGGRLIGEVCHFVDVLQALTNSEPVSVEAANVDLGAFGLSNEDNITLTIQFADGSMGTIHYWSTGDSAYPKERLEVFGQGRIAVLNNFRSVELVASNRKRNKSWANLEKGFKQEAAEFLKACRTGQPAIPFESLLQTSRVTFAAARAIRTAPAQSPDSGEVIQ